MKNIQSLKSLAKKHACTIEVCYSGSIYLDAPDGMLFQSCDSSAILLFEGACVGRRKCNDFGTVVQFAESEIKEGFYLR